jgi:HTH-type transcriptional regulator/antitoxin MqsA
VTNTRIHPETGKVLRRDTRAQTVRVGSLTREVQVPGWYPDDGSDSIHTGAELKASNDAFRELTAQYGEHVKSIRKAAKLSQEEAGRIIGGGRRAFQKYESGKTPPSTAAVGLIELLRRHPEEVEFLRALHGPLPAPAKRSDARKPKGPSRSRSSAHS